MQKYQLVFYRGEAEVQYDFRSEVFQSWIPTSGCLELDFYPGI